MNLFLFYHCNRMSLCFISLDHWCANQGTRILWEENVCIPVKMFSSVQFSCSVVPESLSILLLYIAKERHTWVLCVRQMKINGNNKIIFYLTSPSICFSKSPGYWMCLSLHSFPLQTSAPPSPASHCTGLWEHKQFSGTNIFRVLPQTQMPVKITQNFPVRSSKARSISYKAP